MIGPKQALHAIFAAPISLASLALPKRRGLVVCVPRFLGGHDGNVKYFFLHLASEGRIRDYTPLLLSEDRMLVEAMQARGLPALLHPSRRSVEALLRAEFLIVEAEDGAQLLEGVLARGSRKIQLWHGNGIKALGRIRRAQEGSPVLRPLLHAAHFVGDRHSHYEAVCFASPRQLEVRGAAFRYRHAFINGLPRNDVLFREIAGEELGSDPAALARVRDARRAGLQIALYAPTWRPQGLMPPARALDVDTLQATLAALGVLLVVKLHPKDPDPFPERPNICVHASDRDVYPVLRETGLMITDYSSIYTDFILLDRPVIFLVHDRETYEARRGLVHALDTVACGPQCPDQAALHEALTAWARDGSDPFREQRRALCRQFNAHVGGDASARLLAFIGRIR